MSEASKLPTLAELVEAKKARKATLVAFDMTKQRCYNPNQPDYKFYGGRGITVCQRWLDSKEAFLEDMGPRPEGHTLERRDNDGPYSPENCYWATRKEQTRNRRNSVTITYNGKTQTLEEWAQETGISYSTLKARKQRLGYTDEECITKPVLSGGLLEGKVYKERRKPDMSNVPRGYDAPTAKVNRETAKAMQVDYDKGGETYSSMARKYNVSVETASKVCQREGHHA